MAGDKCTIQTEPKSGVYWMKGREWGKGREGKREKKRNKRREEKRRKEKRREGKRRGDEKRGEERRNRKVLPSPSKEQQRKRPCKE